VLIEHNGKLSIVRGGKRVDANLKELQALIAECVEVQKLVRSTDGSEELVYSPCVLSDGQVRALLTADSLKTGSLPARVMKA